MKIIYTLLAIVLAMPFTSHAQEFPNFGVVSSEEIALKECAFDKDAAAVILLNEAISDHDEQYHLINYHHVRIKILKEKGFEAADITIPFYKKDHFEFIDNLEAVVINTDASGATTTEKLAKKAFYTKEKNERIGIVAFTFPNVKVGSIIEYRYRSFMNHYGGLQDWYFQDELPVVKSKYTLTVLPTTEFTYRINKREDIEVSARVEKDAGKVYFEMENIPGLTEEPYMDAREDYVQKVMFQLSGLRRDEFGKKSYMTSWNEVIQELLIQSEFGAQLGKNIPGTGTFIDEVKKLPLSEDKMKAVYNYVRGNMRWDGRYGKYAIDGVKDPWQKKTGSSGEINLILVNLLKDAGLDAYPALVSERFHGKVNPEVPFIDQFNSVFACVIIKDKKYYLDATDSYTPAHVTPNTILNTIALIVNKKIGGLVNVVNDSLQYSDYITSNTTLDEKGGFSGEVYVRSTGYARIKKLGEYNNEGQEKYINRHFQKNGITVSDFELLNKENDSLPAEQRFKFVTNLASSGDYLYIPLDMFSGFDKNPFLSDNRFSNVNFGYKKTITSYTLVNLPKNYTVDALPKAIKMTTPDKDIVFSRSVLYDKENNSLALLVSFDFKQSLYTVEEYPVLKEVYKKMFDFLKDPVVLKKQ